MAIFPLFPCDTLASCGVSLVWDFFLIASLWGYLHVPLPSVFSHKLTVLEACFDFTSGLFGGQFPGWWLGFVRRNTPSCCLPVDGSSRHGLDPLTLRGCGKLTL